MTDAIRQWVADQTGLTAIWLHPDAPRPGKPYAGLQVTGIQRVGRAYVSDPDAEGEAVIGFDREVTVSITIYESTDHLDPRSALNRAADLRDSLELRTVRENLASNGWSLRAVELLSDAPQLLDTGWEPRAVFDVRMGTYQTLLEDLGLIETATVSGDVSGVDNTHDLEGQ